MRVIVTRSEGQAEPLAEELRRLGHEPVLCPLIRIEPLGDGPVDAHEYDWLVVTSVNGAAEIARRLRGRPGRIAAIGPATAGALRAAGLEPDLVPHEATQEGLLAELPRPAGRVLVAAAARARRLLVDELGADFVPLYRTLEVAPGEAPAGDIVVLASASAAMAWGRLGAAIPAVSIGPQTSDAARAAGIAVIAEARTHDFAGLVAAVASLPARWDRSSPS